MYKVVMADNYLDSKKVEIYEKECKTLEEAEEAYLIAFRQAKMLILDVLHMMAEMDKAQVPVLQQIIEVVDNLGLNEEIELNNKE